MDHVQLIINPHIITGDEMESDIESLIIEMLGSKGFEVISEMVHLVEVQSKNIKPEIKKIMERAADEERV